MGEENELTSSIAPADVPAGAVSPTSSLDANRSQAPSNLDETWKTPPLMVPDAPRANHNTAPTSSISTNAATATPTVKNVPLITSGAPKGKSRSVAIIFGAFLLALLIVSSLLIATVFTDDKGWISSGLSARLAVIPISAWWGGLSANPLGAAEQMRAAIKTGSSFTVTGNYVGYGVNSPVALTTTSSSNNVLAANYTFSLTLLQKNFSFLRTLKDNGIDVQSEYRGVDGDLFIRDNFGASDASNTKDVWLKGGNAPNFTASALKDVLVSALAGSSFVGPEAVKGTRTYHFQAALRGSDVPLFSLPGADTTSTSWKKANGSLELWLARDTHLPMQIKARLTEGASVISVTANVTVADRPVVIMAPDGAVDPGTVALTADQRRKSDLKQVAAALEKYQQTTGSYPIAATPERLDQTDALVVTTLVPSYIGVMPSDPTSGRYYGYISNGLTYELSAVLDDANDSQGVKAGARTLYVVKGGTTSSTAP